MKEYVQLMSESILGERLKADEATTTIALQHKIPLSFKAEEFEWDMVDAHVMSVIRTGAIYILPKDHLDNAIHDLPPSQDLPPLPFPRITIEAEKDGKPSLFMESRDGVTKAKAVTILEVSQGREWDVVIVMDMYGEQEYFAFGIRRGEVDSRILMPPGMSDYYGEGKIHTADELKIASIFMSGFVINLGHLITARNAPKQRLDMPRQQRRAFSRTYKMEPPSVYRVKLDQAGEQEGNAGWHYKVRFLVCGHWRHYTNGERTWVHPYIKGPAGAPWKGRPVHQKDDT